MSRNGLTISFYGNQVYNGGYPPNARFDNEAFGNTRAWPAVVYDPVKGGTTYLVEQSVQANVGSNGGEITIKTPDGYILTKAGNYYSPTVTFNMKTSLGENPRSLVVSTPNLSTDNTKSYLRPKSTTQTFTDPIGRVTSYTFNGNGDMTRVVSPGGVAADITYDGSHRVTGYTSNGSHWGYSYDFSDSSTGGGTTTVTDPTNHTKRLSHQTRPGPVTQVVDELNRTTTYSYDSTMRLTGVTNPESDGATYEYANPRGNLTSITVRPKPSVGGVPLVDRRAKRTPLAG